MSSAHRGWLTVWRSFVIGVVSLILSGPASVCATTGDVRPPSGSAPALHFFCNTGYSQADCDAQTKRLREVLAGIISPGLVNGPGF